MVYEIQYANAAARAIRQLERAVQRRLLARIETLAVNPRPAGAIKLTGHDAYRLRVGDYRVVYAIADDRLIVLVVDVGHRRDIYRKR